MPIPNPRRRGKRSSLRQRPKRSISLRRISSEPDLLTAASNLDGDDRSLRTPLFLRFMTCSDVCSPTPSSPMEGGSGSGSGSGRGYTDESKVLIHVTVEGSSGPVRIVVRLGSTVAETIRVALLQYSKEGRSHPLGLAIPSTFELHHSYFSLEGLNEGEKLGDIGGRSFFLRRRMNPTDESGPGEMVRWSVANDPRFIGADLLVPSTWRRLTALGRKVRKIWKLLGCMACG